MTTPYKLCPICDSLNPQEQRHCRQCGSDLQDVEPLPIESVSESEQFRFERGETDLLEEELARRPALRLFGVLLVSASLVVIAGLGIWVLPRLRSDAPAPEIVHQATMPTALYLATVTPGPPLPTRTPWPSPSPLPTRSPTATPCTQVVVAGDSLISLLVRCGHQHRDVIEQVVRDNSLASADQLAIGQTIHIPWPTATSRPGESDNTPTPVSAWVVPTSTLPPGITWYRVAAGDDIISVAFRYGANLEIMSQLNPEVHFSQCDFGETYGGENCIVQIAAGQNLRVPLPQPSATPSPPVSAPNLLRPTLENIPHSLRPSDGVVYGADELVTLRWVSAGRLEPGEMHVIEVQDVTSGQRYRAETREHLFHLPESWQARDGKRHEYHWRVGLQAAGSSQGSRWTEERKFIWLARASSP